MHPETLDDDECKFGHGKPGRRPAVCQMCLIIHQTVNLASSLAGKHLHEARR